MGLTAPPVVTVNQSISNCLQWPTLSGLIKTAVRSTTVETTQKNVETEKFPIDAGTS